MPAIPSFRANNQFSFVCPLFDAETRIAACFTLRDIFAKGYKIQQRRGCQAAMASCKCPAAAIVAGINFNYDPAAREVYASEHPTVGKLRANVLERVLPVMLQDKHLEQFNVPDAEREKLAGANARIAKQLGHAPAMRDTAPVTKRRKLTPSPAPVSTATEEAARTGDMSAAINA